MRQILLFLMCAGLSSGWVVLPAVVQARTWHVNTGGTGDAPTIAAAVDSAASGDSLLVACGTYYEHDITLDKHIMLLSETPQDARCVTIDAQQQGRVMNCTASGAGTWIQGLSFKGGYANYGGGILCNGPTSPVILDCVFYQNEAEYGGSGIAAMNSAQPEIGGCTLCLNSGGNAVISAYVSSNPIIENCIIAFNPSVSIYCDGTSTAGGVGCSDLYANTGGDWVGCVAGQEGERGNQSADPLFCDIPTGDFTVEECSPCLDANRGGICGSDVGALGSGCGCGEATEPATWGTIKSMYR